MSDLDSSKIGLRVGEDVEVLPFLLLLHSFYLHDSSEQFMQFYCCWIFDLCVQFFLSELNFILSCVFKFLFHVFLFCFSLLRIRNCVVSLWSRHTLGKCHCGIKFAMIFRRACVFFLPFPFKFVRVFISLFIVIVIKSCSGVFFVVN